MGDLADADRAFEPGSNSPQSPVPSRPEFRVATSTVALVAASAVIALLGGVALHEVTVTLGKDSFGVLTIVLNFAILALIIFLMVKQMNRLKRQAPPVVVATPEDTVLLREIRDALKR